MQTHKPERLQSAKRKQSAIAVDAYVYFYPLISMDLTRKQLINTEPGKGFGGPMNTFDNIAAFPDRRYESGRAAQFRHAVFERLG